MRSLIVMAMFAATLSHAAWNGYTETRDLQISSDGVNLLEINAGAGSIAVTGDAPGDTINVKATIHVDDDEEDARRLVDKSLVLGLEAKRGTAKLDSYFDGNFWHGDGTAVDLEVQIPNGLAIFVDDGSGSIRISGAGGKVSVDDGSGSIDVEGASSVWIDDGSGPITIANVSGDVEIDDGSGDIRIRAVGGSVRIDDGSGKIDVSNVERNVEIVDDGSGSVLLSDIRGSIYRDD